MNLNQTIASRLSELFLDGHWVTNTNYKEFLSGIDREVALRKISNLNSIAELTYHINYYLSGLNNVFEGGDLEIRDKFSFDITPIEEESDWQLLVNNLLSNTEKFISYVKRMTDEQLHGPFIVEKYGTYLRNIEGVIEHSYYHLGQMVIIKKMIFSQDN
jgi:hypothetical protein